MQLVPVSKEGYNLFHEGQLALSDIQQNGIKIDTKHCKNSYKRLGQEIKQCEKNLYNYKEVKTWQKKYKDKFSFDSDRQLSDILFNVMEYEPTKRTENDAPSVDKEALEALNLPMVDTFLRYRKLDKLKNTFLKTIIKETYNGYLHPFINLNLARTFRSSSQNPNTQNMPHRDEEGTEVIRKAFVAEEDSYLVASDYGGIEVKGSQFYTRDPVMQKYLDNPETADMHADFCKLLFMLDSYDDSVPGEKTLRKGTKNGFTFPQFYGDYYGNNAVTLWNWAEFKGKKIKKTEGVEIKGNKKLGEHLKENGIHNFKQFENHIAKIENAMWNEKFKVYKQWRDDQWSWYNKYGYVTLLSGFTCQGIMTRNQVINYPIQGCCFHCLLWSIIELNKRMKKERMRSKIIFQVHDETISNVKKDEYDEYLDMVKQIMCHDIKDHYDWICVPLELESEASELEGNWFDMKPVMEYVN